MLLFEFVHLALLGDGAKCNDDNDDEVYYHQGASHTNECITDIFPNFFLPNQVMQKDKSVLYEQEDTFIEHLKSLASERLKYLRITQVDYVQNCHEDHQLNLYARLVEKCKC